MRSIDILERKVREGQTVHVDAKEHLNFPKNRPEFWSFRERENQD